MPACQLWEQNVANQAVARGYQTDAYWILAREGKHTHQFCLPLVPQEIDRVWGVENPRRISKLWALRLASKVEFPENPRRFPACMPPQSPTTQRGRTRSPCLPSDRPSKTRNQVPVQKVLRGWRTLTAMRNELLNYCWLKLCLSEPFD